MGLAYTRISELVRLYETMSGLQQGVPITDRAWSDLNFEAEILVKKIAGDFGYDVKLKKHKKYTPSHD